MATGSRLQRRVIWAVALSVLVHLLFLAAYSRMADWYRQQNLRPTRYLPDLLLLAPDLFRQQPMRNIPERLMEQIAATEAPGESVPLPFIDPELPAPGRVEPVPLDGTLPVPGERLPVFVTQPDLVDFSLNQADIDAVAQLRDQYDEYARYWSPDVDPDDADSQSRTKAEAIVARAFDAMGGLDKLLKVTELRMVVWAVAFEHVYMQGPREVVDTLANYAYPLATWRMYGLNKFERDVFRIHFDLSSGEPFPPYLTKNPARTRQAYYRLFDARWHMYAPGATRKLRLLSENDRWHFADWFLGEGIRLSYAGAGRLGGTDPVNPAVERVVVDDRKYGRQFEAYFDRNSGLLLSTRETLSESEGAWFRQRNNRRAPVWETRFEDYRSVEGVLLPHHWTRGISAARRRAPARELQRIELHFNIAINGADPDTIAPEL